MATLAKKSASILSEKVLLQRKDSLSNEWTTVMYCKSTKEAEEKLKEIKEVYSESECPEYRIAKE